MLLSGINNENNPSGYNSGETLSLDFPTKEGYMFAGWYTDSACTNEIEIINGIEGDLTLYAKWVPYDDILIFYDGIDNSSVEISPDYAVKTVIIPSLHNDLPVTKIMATFRGEYECIETVIIPDSVAFINPVAFVSSSLDEDVNISLECISVDSNNPNFKSVDGVLYSKDGKTLIQYPPQKDDALFTIPDGVTLINDFAFARNKNLKSIAIPNTVTSIGVRAFIYSEALQNIVIPDSVTQIGHSAFSKCASLESVILSNHMDTIEHNMFEYCIKLKNIVIPDSVETIKSWAFDNCLDLEVVELPNNVTIIDIGVFNNCSSLESINIPNNVTSIRNMAFSNCTALSYLVIPDSVITMQKLIFRNCASLTIYCESKIQPEGWKDNWDLGVKSVIWGYKGE